MTNKKNKPKQNRSKAILITLIVLLSLICIPLVAGTGLFFYYVKDAPELSYKQLEDTMSSKFLDPHGKVYSEYGEKKREIIKPNEIPPSLKQAIISIEDKRFEEHVGVDPIRIAGAAVSNFKGNSKQGGSTLTQQLIKLSYFSTKQEDQTIKRKAQEAWLSVELEKKKSKDEILTYYINRVYMSNGVYGMKTAALAYYGLELEDLSLAQYALLAGIPQAPTNYDPYVNKDAAKQRRDLVLGEMKKDNAITEKEYNEAIATPIDEGLQPLKEDDRMKAITDNYVTEVIKETQRLTKKDPLTDGLTVYTNIDLEAQEYLYNLLNDDNSSINFPDDDFQAAATLMDVKTGQVKAQVGGRKVGEDTQGNMNLATQSKRDIGSTIKPLVAYAPAIENLNYGTGELFVDEPYRYPDGTQVYNYDNSYRGTLTMRESLVDSRNVPALKALEQVGNETSQEFIHTLGFDNTVHQSSAITMDASTLQLASAYAAFANGGVYYKPTYISKVVYPDGTEEVFEPDGTRAMKDTTAYIITDMLKDVINRGTAVNAQIPGLIQAGKTGTSNYSDDALDKVIGEGSPDISFVGYTPKYSLAVWTGYKDYFRAIPLYNQGLAIDIYRNYMTYLYQGLEPTDWKQPDGVTRIGTDIYLNDFIGIQNPTYKYYNTQPAKQTQYTYEYVEENNAKEPKESKEKKEEQPKEDVEVTEEEVEEEKTEEQPTETPEEQPTTNSQSTPEKPKSKTE